MSKIKLEQVLIVEGKYDAAALYGLVDGLVLTTDGFSVFNDAEKKALIKTLGRARGLVILTDSDAAGFKIRNYVEKIAAGCDIKHAYIPEVRGKESRKNAPSKEGTLGVEGMPPAVLQAALARAGVLAGPPKTGRQISYTDLYEMGISGGANSAARRRLLLKRAGLPQRLSKRALKEVLSTLYTYEELQTMLNQKTALFWDFHGTLTTYDATWFDCMQEAAEEQVPQKTIDRALLYKHLSGNCLPWWSVPSRDTRHLAGEEAWWGHCEKEFAGVLVRCGYSEEEARRIAPRVREKVLQPGRYTLWPDAKQTLETLAERGYENYILSNNFPELPRLAEQLGLAPLLSGTVVSGLVGFDKPRAEIFEYAQSLAGNPDEAWMIGDNPKDDIEGGRAAGFKTIAVHGATAGADYEVNELSEILNILP